MNYWEAQEATVTAPEVIAECRRHAIAAKLRESDRAIVEIDTGDVVAIADEHGEYTGSDVLNFLGY
ncbi:hypothetical protein [Agrobacterium tumefaciens]|uniref:hypothetical protein n=1 Tax=Agrobacterium tumefaciens TaxID=358 RepID=UPI001571C88C|nr:hypothetical protein [Agrobacterium tumefaciens]